MKRNLFALFVLVIILVGLPAAIFAYRAVQDRASGLRLIEIQARAPEAGGFVPDRIELVAGEPVRLRLVAPDVVHGFAIPELGIDIEEVYPGKPVELTITPQQPGRYAFACTRWCSVDHWRMRGVIEVIAAEGTAPVAAKAKKPLYEQLGIDIDAMRHAPAALPRVAPSVTRGAEVARRGKASGGETARRGEASGGETGATGRGILTDASPLTVDARRTITPAHAFEQLRADPANTALTDDQLWDLVAWNWLNDVSPEALARAESLYSRDCAACHGETGRGDGVAGKDLPGLSRMDPLMPSGPADFTDAGQMLSAPDALLHGKLLRGGMGTGMPEFGSLYTDEELWAMVSYLRTFLFTK